MSGRHVTTSSRPTCCNCIELIAAMFSMLGYVANVFVLSLIVLFHILHDFWICTMIMNAIFLYIYLKTKYVFIQISLTIFPEDAV